MEPITRREMFMAKAGGQDVNTPKPITREEIFLSQIGGSGAGTQPDWNQNDPTKPDYVKNRPFWTDDPVETEIVPAMDLTFNANTDFATSWYETDRPMDAIVAGQEYLVNWNGVEYKCVGVSDQDGVWIGNDHIWWYDNSDYVDNGMPFCIYEWDGFLCVGVLSSADTVTYNVRVAVMVAEAHKIDEKYLPNVGGTNEPDLVIYASEYGTISPSTLSVKSGSVEAVIAKIESGEMPLIYLDGTFDEGYTCGRTHRAITVCRDTEDKISMNFIGAHLWQVILTTDGNFGVSYYQTTYRTVT